MERKERKIDGWENLFTVVYIISGFITFGATWFVYGLIKYAVKAGNREAYNDRIYCKK